ATTIRFYDFISTYNSTESTVNGHETDGTTATGGQSTFTIPADVALTYQIPGQFTVVNGTITGVSAYSAAALAGGMARTVKRLTLSGTSTGGDVVILYAGHLARAQTWGAGKGASSWPLNFGRVTFLNYSANTSLTSDVGIDPTGIQTQNQADLSI